MSQRGTKRPSHDTSRVDTTIVLPTRAYVWDTLLIMLPMILMTDVECYRGQILVYYNEYSKGILEANTLEYGKHFKELEKNTSDYEPHYLIMSEGVDVLLNVIIRWVSNWLDKKIRNGYSLHFNMGHIVILDGQNRIGEWVPLGDSKTSMSRPPDTIQNIYRSHQHEIHMNMAGTEIVRVFHLLRDGGIDIHYLANFMYIDQWGEYLNDKVRCFDIHQTMNIVKYDEYLSSQKGNTLEFGVTMDTFMANMYEAVFPESPTLLPKDLDTIVHEYNITPYRQIEAELQAVYRDIFEDTWFRRVPTKCSLAIIMEVSIIFGIVASGDEYNKLIEHFIRHHGRIGLAIMLVTSMHPKKLDRTMRQGRCLCVQDVRYAIRLALHACL